MNKAQLERERKYHMTMVIAGNLRKQGIISDGEYCQIDTIFKEKYGACLSTIFTDINLLYLSQ